MNCGSFVRCERMTSSVQSPRPVVSDRDRPALLEQAGVDEPHHLRRVAVDDHRVRSEVDPRQGPGHDGADLAGIVLVERLLEPRAGVAAGGVHAVGERARGVVGVPVGEAERRLRDRAGEVLPGEGEGPAVAPREPDGLADGDLRPRGPSPGRFAFGGQRRAGGERADAHREGGDAQVLLEVAVQRRRVHGTSRSWSDDAAGDRPPQSNRRLERVRGYTRSPSQED